MLADLSGQAAGQGKGPTQAWGTLFARRAPMIGFGSVRERIQRAFLHAGELWVEIAFEDWLVLGPEVTDSDGDGAREVFARINPALVDPACVEQLERAYLAPRLSAPGLRDALMQVLDALYTETSPYLVRTIGEPFELPGFGTLQVPFAVIEHANGAVNVVLASP